IRYFSRRYSGLPDAGDAKSVAPARRRQTRWHAAISVAAAFSLVAALAGCGSLASGTAGSTDASADDQVGSELGDGSGTATMTVSGVDYSFTGDECESSAT